jgi:hypothetical protein
MEAQYVEQQQLIANWDLAWSRRHPLRLTKRQKEAFLHELEQELQARHFETEHIEVRTLIKNRLLTTVCEKPRIIFTAHFDTPTIMPFWFPPLFYLFGHTRQITGMIFLLLLLYLPGMLLPAVPPDLPWLSLILMAIPLLFVLSMVTLFIPNPRNREDNTSGVIALMALADWLKDKPDLRRQVQLVFLDNEELGLLGSRGLKQVWDERAYPYAEAAIINLDCVSRGEVPLIVYHGRNNDTLAQQVIPFVQAHFPQARPIDMAWLPLSDNYTFKQEKAINISFANKSLIPGGYYIPRIHSPADNDLNVARLARLLQGLTAFVEEKVVRSA